MPEDNLQNVGVVAGPNSNYFGDDNMSKSMKLGGGGRFEALKNRLSNKPGVTDPAALAAEIGRKKYGNLAMQRMASAGRRRG